jgi:NADH dehydrogenase
MQGTYGNGRLVTVFGGSGFVGRSVVRALAQRGYRVRVAVRRPDLANHVRPLGMVGQIHAVQANVRYPESVAASVVGSVAVVNLVGVLLQKGKQTFEAVHVDGARFVAEATKAAGIETLVHVSAVGVGASSDSIYFRTKSGGEEAVQQTMPIATIVRPTIQFGPGDSFISRFARMAMMLPAIPLIGGNTRFQPVFVGDVAEAIARSVDGSIPSARTYEFGGPEILTFKDLLRRMLATVERRRFLPPVPFFPARILGGVLQRLPGRLLTLDQVRQLAVDNVVSAEAEQEGRTLRGIGIEPTALAAILPTYLQVYRPHGQFSRARDARGG